MSIDKQARRETITHFKTTQDRDDFISLMPASQEHSHLAYDSEAAHQYVNKRLKPLRFASIARLMGVMFRNIFDLDGHTIAHLGDITEVNADKRWQALLTNTKLLLTSAARDIEYDPAFLDNEKLNDLKTELTPGHISTATQLSTGGDTYANAAIFFLRNVQPLARAHGAADAYNPGVHEPLARNSFGIPWSLAMRNINQLVATEYEMAAGSYQLISDAAALWRPSDVRLVGEGDAASFVLANARNPIISPGTMIGKVVIEEPTPMQDIPDHLEAPTIGCPITLLKDRFEQLWGAQVEAAAPLWARDRAPYKTV